VAAQPANPYAGRLRAWWQEWGEVANLQSFSILFVEVAGDNPGRVEI